MSMPVVRMVQMPALRSPSGVTCGSTTTAPSAYFFSVGKSSSKAFIHHSATWKRFSSASTSALVNCL